MLKTNQTPELLTIKQAASLLNVSEVSLRRWTNTGQLTCLRVGTHRARRFRREDLLEFMEHQSANKDTTVKNEQTSEQGKRNTYILLEGIAIDYGNHLCSLYEDSLGQQKLSVPLLADGLQKGDACFLVATKQVQAELIQHLVDAGKNPIKAIENGQLQVTTGMSSGVEMLDYLRQQFTLATRTGNRSLRLVGDMSWALDKGWDTSELLSYEQSYNNSLGHQFPVVSLCQYNVNDFSGQGVLNALRCHEDTFHYPLGRFLGSGDAIMNAAIN